jgi:GrpB-like predicted nucleotidyltransferase (UPF0157 family)
MHAIDLVAYRESWVEDYAVEARRIKSIAGDMAWRIDHVGSTAVPGLMAKPVIDIQVTVPALTPIEPLRELLGLLGYHFVPLGDFDKVYPFFTRPLQWPSTHHVHLCEPGSAVERNHRVFRDYLSSHPPLARQYEVLKLQLAAQHHGRDLASRECYSLGKTEFVHRVLRLAEIEALELPPRQ